MLQITAACDERSALQGGRSTVCAEPIRKILLKAPERAAVTVPWEIPTMPAMTSELELSDLDFTATVMLPTAESREATDGTDRVLAQLEVVIDSIALKVEVGSTDERLWRILAGVYMAMERITDYNDLVRKHLATFGRSLELDQPGITFALPVKVNRDDIPKLDMIMSACATPGGAALDFGAVRRVSGGGMLALSELLLALVPVSAMPQMRGIEAFIASIEAAIKAGQGGKEMQELVGAYRRFAIAHPKQPAPAVAAVA